jgi:anti-anti-sigma factor
MQLHERTSHSVSILELNGRFDAHSAIKVQTWLDNQMKRPPSHIVINLQGVTFVDSTALSAMVQGMKRCRQLGGDLRLCAFQQTVRIIFELTRMDLVFEIFSDEATAVR